MSKRRVLAWVMALALCLSLLPVGVMASEDPEKTTEAVVNDEAGQLGEIVEPLDSSEEPMAETKVLEDGIISAELDEAVDAVADAPAPMPSVAIDEAHFPDAVFRGYVSENCDVNGDGFLSETEIAAVTSIYVSYMGITSLDGIENFSSLTELYCDGDGGREFDQLTTLDVSGCTALERLVCRDNLLTSLDVSDNSSLKYLDCDGNKIEALDVSGCAELKYLYCGNNDLRALDVSSNTALEALSCSFNNLALLDLSNNTALERLFCGNNALTALDVSYNAALELIFCDNNDLSALDVSHNTGLLSLACVGNAMTTLDVSHNTALVALYCSDNNLTALDVSNNTALEYLDCYTNALTMLDVSHNSTLFRLQCYGNTINNLDVSGCTRLLSRLENAVRSEQTLDGSKVVVWSVWVDEWDKEDPVLTCDTTTEVITDGIIFGTCGDGVYWKLEDGVLTIYGEGKMDWPEPGTTHWLDDDGVWHHGSMAPWREFITQIESVAIEEGVTNIEAYAFAYCDALKSVMIPSGIMRIEEGAFSGCSALTSVTFPGNAPTIGEEAFYDVTATAYYPYGDDTWTADVMQNYGGTITWVCDVQTRVDTTSLPAETENTLREKAAIPAENKNVVAYDVTVQLQQADGSWIDATSDNFPLGGISITLDYPAGTDKSMSFAVYHLLVSGEVETLTPAKTDEGLAVVVSSLSPFAITWDGAAGTLLGDVNGDGEITSFDASVILRYEVGLVKDTEIDLKAADVNGDGDVTSFDASLILRYEVGLITSFPAEK